jgi:hypothetical protein
LYSSRLSARDAFARRIATARVPTVK